VLLFSVLILPVTFANAIACLASIPAFGYVFYSIYYQKFITDSWCPLCLGVQAVLTILFLVSILFFPKIDFTILADYHNIAYFSLIAISITGTYILVKPYIEAKTHAPSLERRYLKLKHNQNIVSLLFQQQEIISTKDVRMIELGNPNAKDCITVIFSPTCNICINELKILLSFLSSKESTKIGVIFLLNRERYPNSYPISCNLLSFYFQDPKRFSDILQNYVNNYPASKKKATVLSCTDTFVKDVLKEQDTWCKKQKFTGTPVVLFNNRIIPNTYSIEDIDYMCF
jgi:hypothetical protein